MPPGPISLNLIFSYKWLESELYKIFHDVLGLIKKHVPLSTTSIVVFNTSIVHMPFLLVITIQFICGGFLLVHE
jgi:hypothetical protein